MYIHYELSTWTRVSANQRCSTVLIHSKTCLLSSQLWKVILIKGFWYGVFTKVELPKKSSMVSLEDLLQTQRFVRVILIRLSKSFVLSLPWSKCQIKNFTLHGRGRAYTFPQGMWGPIGLFCRLLCTSFILHLPTWFCCQHGTSEPLRGIEVVSWSMSSSQRCIRKSVSQMSIFRQILFNNVFHHSGNKDSFCVPSQIDPPTALGVVTLCRAKGLRPPQVRDLPFHRKLLRWDWIIWGIFCCMFRVASH